MANVLTVYSNTEFLIESSKNLLHHNHPEGNVQKCLSLAGDPIWISQAVPEW